MDWENICKSSVNEQKRLSETGHNKPYLFGPVRQTSLAQTRKGSLSATEMCQI